jgi:hypothetical protein
MAGQLLSDDPNAGLLLSSDPSAGVVANFTQSDTTPNEVDANTVGTTVRHWWSAANPVQLGQLLPWPKELGGSGRDNPLLPSNVVKSAMGVKQQADALWDKGDKVGATAKYIESVVPFLGPMMSHMGDEAQQGKWAAFLGDALGLATNAAAPSVVPKAAAAVGTLRETTAPLAEVVLKKKLGMDPDALSLAATKMRLQAARSQTRQARTLAQMAEESPSGARPSATAPVAPVTPPPTREPIITPPPATSPVESVSGGTRPPSGPPPSPAPASATATAAPQSLPIPVQAGETLATPAAARTAGQMSDAWLSSDVGLVAKRLQMPLTAAQKAEAVAKIRETGMSPVDAVTSMPSSALYVQLRQHGLSHTQAQQTMAAQSAMEQLQQKLGTLTPDQVNAEIAARVGNRSPRRD